MKHTLAVVLAMAVLLAGMPAVAGGYGHRHGGYGYGYGHGYGHYGTGFSFRYSSYGHGDALGYLALGAVVGALIARPYYPPPRPVYRPRPVYTQVQPQHCQPTTGTGYYNGRPAVFGGTYCRTVPGQGYIVAGSEHFLGYR